jgi:hypothetical protein
MQTESDSGTCSILFEKPLCFQDCHGNLLLYYYGFVRKVISGSGNRSDPRPDRGRLSCMSVGPLSRSATIKGVQAGAREPTFTVLTVPSQTLTT